MALPDEPKTDTSSAPPPPKKPPAVSADELFGQPAKVSSPAQTISNRRIPDISDDELVAAFKDKPLYVLGRVNWNKTKSPYRQRLENLIAKDPSLQKILDYVLPVYPPAPAQVQPQTVKVAEPPVVTAEKLKQAVIQPAPEALKKNDLGPQNAKEIGKWMNGLKPGFYEYLADKQFSAASSANVFSQRFLEYLTLYKGGLAGFYLSQGSLSAIFSAMGPVGDALSFLHQKDMKRKVAWMKNPLNPTALYYWLNVMPEEKAFEVALLPAKAVFAILARGGGPFTKATYYDHFEKDETKAIKEKYFFTPFLRAGQAAHIAADGLDKVAGITFDKKLFRSFEEQTNWRFASTLKNLKSAKKVEIVKARRELRNLLDEYDGFYRYFIDKKTGKPRKVSELSPWRRTVFGGAGVSRAIFGKILKNTAKRLRRTDNDPISFLFILIGGLIWDATVGFALNILRVAATKIINAIPGLNTLRAQTVEFFSSNRFLNTARIGGATGQAFLRGTFSMTTASSVYGGASIGGWVANALGLPTYPFQIIGGGIGATFGSIYTTSLKMAANPGIMEWIYKYDDLLFKATDPYSSVAQQNFYRGQLEKNFLNIDSRIANFRPGPFSNFARWLYNHPFARLPINGFVIADLGVKFLGWNPWVAYPSLIAGDWVWQTRGAWGQAFAHWFPTTPLGRWIGNQALSVQTWFTEKIFMRPIAWETSSLLGKMPVQWGLRPFWQFMKNTWSTIQPYASNFFNPGFFMGFNFISFLTPTLGGWAYLIGPVLGSGLWLGVSRLVQSIVGGGAGFLSSFSAWGWTGYIVGSILDLIIPGAQPWLAPALGIGFPMIGAALHMFGLSFTSLLSSGLGWLGTAIPALSAATGALAGWLATWSTAMAIGSVALFTVFFAYTVYAGFWVPMIAEWQAGPISSNFSININCSHLPNNKYQCCSSFDITEELFNLENFLTLKMNFEETQLSVDLTDPRTTTQALRRLTGEQSISLNYIDYVGNLTYRDYAVMLPTAKPLCVGYGCPQLSELLADLSTPTNQQQNLFELMQQNSSVVSGMRPFFDILTSLAEEYGKTQHLVAEYEAQLALMKEQKKLVDDLIPPIKDGNLNKALSVATSYLDDNPLDDPCPEGGQPCTPEQQTLKQLYDSWKNMVNRYISTINLYLNQTGPQLDNFLASLEQESEGLKQQIAQLPEIIKQMKGIQEKIKSQADADAIINANFSNFTNMITAEQNAAWALLKEYFPDVFDKGKTFYFIPQGTNYRFCADADYSGQPGVPQTVCSTISANQSFWTAGTAFAKHCTTFTPK